MFGKRWRERQRLKAVHDDDLEGLLESLGLLEAVRGRRLQCDICGDALTLDNLLSVFPMKDRIGLCCDKPSCLEQLLLVQREASNA